MSDDTKPHIPLSELRHIWQQARGYYAYFGADLSDVFRDYVADEVSRRTIAELTGQIAAAQEEIERGRARYEAAIEGGLTAHAGTWQPIVDDGIQEESFHTVMCLHGGELRVFAHGVVLNQDENWVASFKLPPNVRLCASQPATHAGTYQPVEDGEVAWGNLAVIDNGAVFDFAGGYDDDTDTFAWHDLVELPPDIRLCQLQPGAYQPIPDGPIGPGATLENRVIWIKCTVGDGIGVKHGYALQDGEVLMRLQPGNPLGKGDGVAPDWSAAPEWAMWWAVDPNGYACWYQEEPVLSLTISYCGWFAKTILGVQQGNALWSQELDLALGIDWRTLKQRRQIAPG